MGQKKKSGVDRGLGRAPGIVASKPAPIESSPGARRKLSDWTPMLLVGAAAVGTYLNALGGGFVSDAFQAIANNRAILHSEDWFVWFVRDFYWGTPLNDVTLYRPLTMLSFLVHIRTTGVWALPFLLVNVLLHAGVSVLVFWLGTRLMGRRAAFLGALIFAVHPLHTEAVAWIMGRSELLAALFALAACLSFLRATDRDEPRPWRFTVGAVLAYLAALFSKEHVALLPLWFGLVWLIDRPTRSERHAAYIGVGSVVAFALFLLLRSYALTREVMVGDIPIGVYNPAAAVSAPLRWLTAAAAVWRYTRLFFWPAKLSSDYSYAQTQASTGLGLAEAAGIVVILGVFAGIILAWRRVPGVALALALAPISFFLVSNFPFLVGTVMAERLTYLPSAGLSLVAGQLLAHLPWPARVIRWRGFTRTAEGDVIATPPRAVAGREEPGGWAVAGLVVVIIIGLSVRTLVRNPDWAESYTIYSAALRVSPMSTPVLGALARMELNKGNLARAMELAQEAHRLYPKSYFLILGDIYLQQKDLDRAAEQYRKAIALVPRDPGRHVKLGTTLQQAGLLKEAEQEFNEAVRLDPGSFQGRLALGRFLLETDRPRDAFRNFQEGARARPRDPFFVYAMATALLALGDRQGAVAYAERAAATGFRVPEVFWRAVGSPEPTPLSPPSGEMDQWSQPGQP